MDDKLHINIKNAATILLYSVAKADHNIEKEEIQSIREIIEEFFSISIEESYSIMENSIKELKNSTSFFKYGQILNENFSYQDKLDFIKSFFSIFNIPAICLIRCCSLKCNSLSEYATSKTQQIKSNLS